VRDAKEYIESSISLIGYLSQMEVPVLEKMKHFGTLPVLKKAFGIKN
jgi:hypothetical protein